MFTNHNRFEEKGEPKRVSNLGPSATSLTPYRWAKPADEVVIWLVPGETAALSAHVLCTLYARLQCHFMLHTYGVSALLFLTLRNQSVERETAVDLTMFPVNRFYTVYLILSSLLFP